MSNWKLDTVIAPREQKTIYRDGDHTIKLFNETFSKSDILNEALNQSRIEETGLNIPKVIEVTRIDGKWAIIADYIEGATLGQMMKDHPEKMNEYLNLYVDLQMEVHTKRAPLLNKLRDKMNQKITKTDLPADTKYDLHMRLDSMPRHNKVLHGDFSPANIVMTKDGTPFILDWAHATQGNASADVARSYMLFYLKNEEATAEAYMELFCRKSETQRRYIESWLPIVAASQSVKNVPEQREFLHHWIGVFDYE